MKIPFVDLKSQYRSLKGEIDDAIRGVIDETAFVRGPHVEEFERAFAAKNGAAYAISCANGTDAIYITLKALGIGPGDEVITVANSWISTSETITQAGATPVFVDIDRDYYHIDPLRIVEEKITPRTKAVIPVHLYGQPALIDDIRAICESHGLYLIEDCAQAHFATCGGRKVGTFGIAGTFSFYPGKEPRRVWRCRGDYHERRGPGRQGQDVCEPRIPEEAPARDGRHQQPVGRNPGRDPERQAEVRGCLERARNQHALEYNRRLAGLDRIRTPRIRENAFHIFHLYVIRAERRDALAEFLKSKQIDTGIHYPTALPFLKAYPYLKHEPSDFPVAHRYQNEILSLPMFPELDDAQIDYVANSISEYFK